MATGDKIYEQLNTFTLGGSSAASAANVALLTNPVHIQESNVKVLEAANTINEALFRDGLHIPSTQKVVSSSVSESGTRATIITPEKGEVWTISSATVSSVAGGSGGVGYTLYILYESTLMSVVYREQTTPPVHLLNELEWIGDFTIDENVTLQWSATRTSLSESTIEVLMHRIR